MRPLALGLLTEEQSDFAKGRLIKALENYGWRLGTGFLSTPMTLDVLADIDIEAAYKLLENEEIPGWLSMPKLGASTIWESWEGPYNKQGAGAGSLNHYSKGAVCAWFFSTVCGIRVEGENRFAVAPRPGGSLREASASYRSLYGKVESEWEKTEAGYVFRSLNNIIRSALHGADYCARLHFILWWASAHLHHSILPDTKSTPVES